MTSKFKGYPKTTKERLEWEALRALKYAQARGILPKKECVTDIVLWNTVAKTDKAFSGIKTGGEGLTNKIGEKRKLKIMSKPKPVVIEKDAVLQNYLHHDAFFKADAWYRAELRRIGITQDRQEKELFKVTPYATMENQNDKTENTK